MHPIKITIATIAILVAAVFIFFSLPSGSSPTIAYAEVVAQIEHVKTVQYLDTRSISMPQRKLRGPTEVTKVTVSGRSRERREVISTKAGDALPDGAVWGMAEVGLVLISDCASGKYVNLDINNKTFGEIQGFASLSPDDGTMPTTKPRPAPEVDFYKRIRAFPAEEAERLPLQEVSGKKVIGFRTKETVNRKHGVDTWTKTYWINPTSKLPVQIEVTFESTSPSPSSGRVHGVLSGIIFDEPIDDALLSTEPPEGYTVLGVEEDD